MSTEKFENFLTSGRRRKKACPQVQEAVPQVQEASPQVQDQEYKLTCYIAGYNHFPVFVPRTAAFELLTERIREKGELEKFNCDILEMSFWKVCQDWRAV
jgi:hypothetical protein